MGTKGSLHGSPSGHEVVGDDGMDGTSQKEVSRQVFRERDEPTRAGFYKRGASYSGGLGGGQEFTIWGGSVDAGWGGSTRAERGVAPGGRGEGELVHSRAGLGMAVEEFSFRSGDCEGTSGSSASKNAGFNRSMLTVSSMPFIRKVNTFADRLRTS